MIKSRRISFGRKNLKEIHHYEDLDIYVMTVLKMDVSKTQWVVGLINLGSVKLVRSTKPRIWL
jgi:hypothetical protein